MQPFFSDELEDLLDKLLRPSPRASVKEVLLRPWMKNATALRVGSMEQRRGSAPFLGLPNMPMISPGNVRPIQDAKRERMGETKHEGSRAKGKGEGPIVPAEFGNRQGLR